MSPELTVVEDAPAEKPFYCPGCGTRYDTPGVCTGPIESGHQPMAVVPSEDETATPEEAAAAAKTADPEAGGIAPVEGVTNEPFDPAVAGVPTIAQHSAVVAKVTTLEGAFGALHEDVATAIAALGGRVQLLEEHAKPASEAKAAPPEPPAPAEPAAPVTGFTPAAEADAEATTKPPEGWPGS